MGRGAPAGRPGPRFDTRPILNPLPAMADREKQLREFEIVVNRAKRASLAVHEYPDVGVAVIRLPPPELKLETPAPAAPSVAAASPN